MTEQDLTITKIPASQISADEEFNCRGKIAPIDVHELAQDIKRQGLISPIIVRRLGDGYSVVAGFRRFKACLMVGLAEIPCIVRELTEADARVLNLTENLQRKSLNMLQEAKAVFNLFGAGLQEDEISKRLGMSRAWVQVRSMLLRLPEEIQKLAAAGLFNQTQIRDLFMMSEEEQIEAIRRAKDSTYKKQPLIPKKKYQDLTRARTRSRPECFALQEHIRKQLGPNLATRVLAWAAGEISTIDLEITLNEYARLLDKKYVSIGHVLF